ncbi:MAG: hypothetical protein M0037_06300 [Betaproteobacteria bacterium]|nr:hypothetical protein [Betaproteobacteria bacterium]
MQAITSFDEYQDLVHQAVYEVDELRACIEDDLEEMERYMPFIDQMDAQLRALYADMVEGRYLFADADLPFMTLVKSHGQHIPFRRLLETINTVHRKGLSAR